MSLQCQPHTDSNILYIAPICKNPEKLNIKRRTVGDSISCKAQFAFLSFCLLPAPALIAQIPSAPVKAAAHTPASYVNVFTGTSNSRWMMFPGATLPFGMVKLSPDNQGNVWNGGYEYTTGSISGFSHLHAMALSGLSVMPVTGDLTANEGWSRTFTGPADGPFGGMWTAGYRSRFKKETEKAYPGYYSVDLLDYGVKAELTSTLRCGMMRFTYPPNSPAHLILNFDFATEEKNEVIATHLEAISRSAVKGYIRQKNGYAGVYTVYFVLELNTPVNSIDGWSSTPYNGKESNYGTGWRQATQMQRDIKIFDGAAGSGAVLNFDTGKSGPVVIRTGISFVSMDQAAMNLDREMKSYGFDFDRVARSAYETWDQLLGAIRVSGGEPGDKEKFYTNFYRTFTGKSILNDANGQYRDGCGQVQTLPSAVGAVYSSDAFWGTQWDLTPLWTLATPSIAESWVKSFLELAEKGGWIPYAPVALGYAPIMGAQHQNSLIISAYQKGIRGFDTEKAYHAILHDYTTPGIPFPCGGFAGDRHLGSYMHYGFVDDESGPASNTLEYAYDDWCFGQFAKALGKDSTYRQFDLRSRNYTHIFDTASLFMRRRHADGSWVLPFDPQQYGTVGGWNGKGFMEGTAYQYSFFVPQDVRGLIKLMGRDSFIDRLETGFARHLFDLGNQPCLALPFFFNYAGKPWLTQRYTREITREMFDTSPYRGWAGEEDEGQLSAIYVLLSMGLFEVDGGCALKPYYDLSTPVFDRIVIRLDPRYYPGGTFTIECKNNGPGNAYIQSATLNGRPIDRVWLYHSEIAKGGRLLLTLGPRPNKTWGLAEPPVESPHK